MMNSDCVAAALRGRKRTPEDLLIGARRLGGLTVAIALLGLVSAQADAQTLEEAVKLAVETHPTVAAAEAQKRAREQQIDEARAPFFPRIDGRITSGYERTNTPGTRGRATRGLGGNDPEAHVGMQNTNSSFTFRQMVFDGFETWNRMEAAKERSTAAGFQVRDSQELIALRATEAYLSVLRAREIVALAEENVEAHVEVLDDVRIRAQQGGGNIADVRQAEARLALARTRLTELRGDLRDSETDFIEAVGAVPGELELPESPEDAVPEVMDDAVTKSVVNNPAVQAATIRVGAERQDIEASNGVFWPRLDIELQASRNQNIGGSRGPDTFYQAFAVARWNFLRGGGDLARKRRETEEASRAVQLEAETKRLVEEQARVDFNARQVALERLPTLEDRVLAADQVVAAYRQQFQLGQRTLLDVLDVENELFQARVSLVTGEFDLRVASYQILATMGTLGPTLGVVAAEEEMAAQ